MVTVFHAEAGRAARRSSSFLPRWRRVSQLMPRPVSCSSADWQIVLPDGTALGDIRYTLQTDDGDLLYVQSRDVRHGSADVLARLARGEAVDASEYTFRTSTQIETAAPGRQWLHKGVF